MSLTRRNFFAASLGAPALLAAQDATAPDPTVKRVLVMFKCHLDVGFTDTQAHVIEKYFQVYFPRAIETAAAMRQAGADRYIWTTGSWLVYEYLETAAPAGRRHMERALAAGDLAWHALPFTWQTELIDPSAIEGALGFSDSLDRRFGRKTTGAKMTDVPGHTRALVGALAGHGVKLLHIGVNSASTTPDVSPAFLWKDPAGHSLAMLYHHRYGGVTKIPASDLAIDIEVRHDNGGPHTLAEIHKIYSGLRRQFPNAEVKAANLSEIANAVEPHRAALPVVTREIGDTWIYGVPSDPVKVARFREVARLRRGWIAAGKLRAGDAADLAFLRRFLLEAEHTWGTDTKTWLDFDHYMPADLATMLGQPKYKVVQSSWAEKRQDLFDAVAALPAALRAEASNRIEGLKPAAPDTAGLQPQPAAQPIRTKHFEIALDPRTGAIARLRNRSTGRDWASPRHPLALFSYQTLSKDDYDRFFAAYLKSKADWAPKDFGKPNIEKFGAQSRTWQPVVTELRHGRTPNADRVLAALKIDDAAAHASGRVAWPEKIYLELLLPDVEPVVEVSLSWSGKPASRMPEALWLSFQPQAGDPRGWMLDKSGAEVSPFDVVAGGNRAMHAVLDGIRYRGREGTLAIDTLDAPVVALGERMPVRFTREQPDLSRGFHFSLFNNGWGTNYVQWFGEDMRFRFRVAG